MSNYEHKTGHPIAGIILAILGMAAAIFLPLLAGLIGGGVAAVFGLLAILFGALAIKGGRKGGGITSIIAGVLAVILAVTMTMGSIEVLNKAKQQAKDNPNTPLLAKYLDNPNLGLIGIFNAIPKDETAAGADFEALRKEIDILNGTTEAPKATEAPAQETVEETKTEAAEEPAG